MKYQIEINNEYGMWEALNDRDANQFDTIEEAQHEIPELARIFDCPESDFRVVEFN